MQDGIDGGKGAVEVEFDDILASEAVRSGEGQNESFVEDEIARAQRPKHRGARRVWESGKFGNGVERA